MDDDALRDRLVADVEANRGYLIGNLATGHFFTPPKWIVPVIVDMVLKSLHGAGYRLMRPQVVEESHEHEWISLRMIKDMARDEDPQACATCPEQRIVRGVR